MLRYLLLAVLLMFLLIGGVAHAAPNDTITITATGTGCQPISDFLVIANDYDDIPASWVDTVLYWDLPTVEYVRIRRSFTEYPSTITDGELVYQGSEETTTEILPGTDIDYIYYSAWTYTAGQWSAPVHYLLMLQEEEETGVSIPYMMILFIILTFVFIIISYIFGSVLWNIISGLLAIATGLQLLDYSTEWIYVIVATCIIVIGLYQFAMVPIDLLGKGD